MTSKQNQFNLDKVHLLNVANSSYVTGNDFGLDQQIRFGMNETAKKFNKLTTVPEDGSQANILQRTGSTVDVAASELYKKEILSKKISKAMLLGGTAATASFEYVPGLYEAAIGYVGVSALQAVGNSGSMKDLLISSAAAGAITATVTTAEQALAGVLTANTIRRFPKTFKFYDDHKKHPTSEKKKEKDDTVTGIFFGAPVAIVEQNLRDPDRNLKQDLKLTAKVSRNIFIYDTALVGSIAAGIQTLEMANLNGAAMKFETIAKNPVPYICLFGLLKYLGYRKEKKQEKKQFIELVNSPLPIE
jgi:hypothetical protein